MQISSKHLFMALALLVTLWLTWKTSENKSPTIAAPTRTIPDATTQSMVTAQHQLDFTLQARDLPASTVNLFASPVKFYKKKVERMPVTIATKAQAPALPFKFLGRWKSGNTPKIFIDIDGEIVGISKGQQLNAQYKVIDIQETNQKTTISFLYLPLNQKQTMFIGKSNHE